MSLAQLRVVPKEPEILADLPDLVTVKEAATVLRLGQSSVLTMIHTGRLRASRPGGVRRWLILKRSLLDLLGGYNG